VLHSAGQQVQSQGILYQPQHEDNAVDDRKQGILEVSFQTGPGSCLIGDSFSPGRICHDFCWSVGRSNMGHKPSATPYLRRFMSFVSSQVGES